MIRKNSLVIYKHEPALVVEIDDKYTIKYRGGTQRVREKDIALLHAGPFASLDGMCKAAEALVKKADTQVRLEEAYELLADDVTAASEKTVQNISLSSIEELAFG